MGIELPGESRGYPAARDRLLDQEMELRRAIEAVAAARRELPPGVDYHAETPEGAQRPMLTVLHRDADAIRHFWSSELFYAATEPGQDPRHVGTLEPLWNMLDLIPEGRPRGWAELLSYARRPA